MLQDKLINVFHKGKKFVSIEHYLYYKRRLFGMTSNPSMTTKNFEKDQFVWCGSGLHWEHKESFSMHECKWKTFPNQGGF